MRSVGIRIPQIALREFAWLICQGRKIRVSEPQFPQAMTKQVTEQAMTKQVTELQTGLSVDLRDGHVDVFGRERRAAAASVDATTSADT